MYRTHKAALKEDIKKLFKEHGSSDDNQKLVAKHIGAILRDTRKENGVAVDKSLGKWASDLVRSSAQQEREKEISKAALKKQGIDVGKFIKEAKPVSFLPAPSDTHATPKGTEVGGSGRTWLHLLCIIMP